MQNDKWLGYLILVLVIYTCLMIYFFENNEVIGNQINFSIIIGLILIILLKPTKY